MLRKLGEVLIVGVGLGALLAVVLGAQAPPPAPGSVTYQVIRPPAWPIDSGDAVEVRWSAVPGAIGYHVRVIDSSLAIPPPPNDVDSLGAVGAAISRSLDPTGGWHQFGLGKTLDTFYVRIRTGQRFPTRAIVRAVAVGVGPFTVSSSQGLSRCPCPTPGAPPPPPAPPPAPPPPPPPPTIVTTLELAPSTVGIQVGQGATFTVTVRENNVVVPRGVTWSSSDMSVSAIDSSGGVYGLAPGTTIIKASRSGVTAAATLTVMPSTVRTEVTYADVTLKNGKVFISRVDSGSTAYVRVIARSSTQDSLGRYRGGGFSVRPFMAANVYPSHVRQTVADIVDPTNHDTADVTLQQPHVAVLRVRCAPKVGCWLTVTNVGRTGSWTSSPKINAMTLNGLAKALEAAGKRAPLTPADSLPYIRVLP